MKKKFELFGYPGSGKSLVLLKFKNNNNNISSFEHTLFSDMLKQNKLSYIYYLYIKLVLKYDSSNFLKTKVLIKKNTLFKKSIFKNLDKEINKQYYLFSKSYPNTMKQFRLLVNVTNNSKDRKKKLIKNFKTYCASYYYYLLNYVNSDKLIINDEGFIQRVFLNYKELNDKKIFLLIEKYLKTLPKDFYLINLTTPVKKSISQCEKRGKYFSYNKNINFLKELFPKINKRVLKFCIKNKLRYYKIDPDKKNIKLDF